MRKLSRYFVTAFNVDQIGEKRLYLFASDHLKKLHELNDYGQFDHIIEETQPAVLQMYSLMEKTKSNRVKVSDSSKSMSELHSSFVDIANKVEGLIKVFNGKKSSKYRSVFPQGLTEYTRANQGTILGLCMRLQFFAESLNGDLPQELRVEIETFSRSLREKLKHHQENREEKNFLKGLRLEARNRVSKQLYKNLLIIASGNIGKPDVSERFFDQNLLENKTS